MRPGERAIRPAQRWTYGLLGVALAVPGFGQVMLGAIWPVLFNDRHWFGRRRQ